MPERMTQMWWQLGLREGITDDWARTLRWGALEPGTQTKVGDILFPRIELVESA